jgi:hypothetical protein
MRAAASRSFVSRAAFGLLGLTMTPSTAALGTISEKLQPFWGEHVEKICYPRDVAARPVQADDKPGADGILAHREDNRNCRGGGFRRKRSAAIGIDHGHPAADQVGRQFRHSIVVTLCPAVFDTDIAVLDKPSVT